MLRYEQKTFFPLLLKHPAHANAYIGKSAFQRALIQTNPIDVEIPLYSLDPLRFAPRSSSSSCSYEKRGSPAPSK